MVGNDEDRDRSRRPSVEDRGWSSTGWVLGDWTIESRVTSCAILHRAQGDDEREFLGLASKSRSTVSPSLASKPVATVLLVWPQNHSLGFLGLGLKFSSRGLMIWPTKSL
jgi:hypothetical protein